MNTSICAEAFVALATPRFNEIVEFYQAFLSQPPAVSKADSYAEFRLPGLKIGIFQPQKDNQKEFLSPHSGGLSICLEVRNLKTAISHLSKLGYPPPGGIIQASHGQEIYAYDPDGNRLILHEKPQRSR